MIRFTLKREFEITPEEARQLEDLFMEFFSDYYTGRIYYKQLPHYRILAKKENKVIGQLSLDYRMMALNKIPVKVLGISDVCITKDMQYKGIAGNLLKEAEQIATLYKLDFMLLFADNPRLYLKNGFTQCTSNTVKWLKIHEHESLGLGEEIIKELMIKEIGKKKWEPGWLDMMGYLY